MTAAGSSWRGRAAGRLRGVARRLDPPGPTAAPVTAAGLPLDAALPLLYPDVADTAALGAAARAVLGGDEVTSTADLRRLLGALDRQAYPSPVTVRSRPADVSTVDLGRFKLVVDGVDAAVSSALLASGGYEPHVTALCAQLCSEGMTALDIGANIGFHTLSLSRLVGPSGKVVAFEPNSENLRLLLASLEVNAVDNVELVPLALDGARGWSHFTTHVGSNGGLVREEAPQFVEGGGFIVPTGALDDLITGPVDFVKIDVEGGEGRVLAGAGETIRRNRPVVITEFSCEMLRRVSAIDPLEYLEFFADLGYCVHVIERDRPGVLGPSTSPGDLLEQWGDELRVEDLALLPD